MSSFGRTRLSSNIKWIITWVLVAMLTVAMIVAFVKIDKNEDTKTIGANSLTYSVGIINDSGIFVEDNKTGIAMSSYYSVDGLTCDLKEDAKITYSIFFYDEDKTFLESAKGLIEDFDGSEIPETAEYFRIMIDPTEDDEVKWYEVNGYAKQLTVTVNK